MNKINMKINLIAALDQNNGIGIDNKLPWYIPNDLRYFKRVTNGKVIIMGRKTFESFKKPLPNRTHIVLSRQPLQITYGHYRANSIFKALQVAGFLGVKEVFVIGGANTYSQFLPLADAVYLTRIFEKYKCDTYFPIVDYQKFTLSKIKKYPSESNTPEYFFEVWERN